MPDPIGVADLELECDLLERGVFQGLQHCSIGWEAVGADGVDRGVDGPVNVAGRAIEQDLGVPWGVIPQQVRQVLHSRVRHRQLTTTSGVNAWNADAGRVAGAVPVRLPAVVSSARFWSLVSTGREQVDPISDGTVVPATITAT